MRKKTPYMRQTCFLSILLFRNVASAFFTSSIKSQEEKTFLRFSDTVAESDTAFQDDSEIQWDLFKKHHAKGSYKGIWTSFDYIGDVIDETVASVNLDYDEVSDSIQHTHTIVVGATQADCATCFDRFETKDIPVGQYTSKKLRKSRLGSIGMVNGPSLLRSGAMATELILSYGNGRIRVVFQHAPVWPAGIEPGSSPPSGLKLFRTTVSREAIRESPPTATEESANPPSEGNPIFFRGVPPFAWHKEWAGTSWTWGPQAGNRGWNIERMEEADAWHGRPTGDSPNVWNLRLPGGITLFCPRIVSNDEAGIFRLAWLPREDTLVRLEVSVIAMQPMLQENDMLVGFYPPSLGSLRCDTMTKIGELEESPRFLMQEENSLDSTIKAKKTIGGVDSISSEISSLTESRSGSTGISSNKSETNSESNESTAKIPIDSSKESSDDSDFDEMRDSLVL